MSRLRKWWDRVCPLMEADVSNLDRMDGVGNADRN